jgi:hypothetical protein
MLANGRAEYAFEVVDPAVPPELKVRPHRLLMTFLGLIFGFVAAFSLAWLIDRLTDRRRASAHAGAPLTGRIRHAET